MQDFFEHFSKLPIDNDNNKYGFDLSHGEKIKQFFQDHRSNFDSNANDNLIVNDILNSPVTLMEVEMPLKS